MSCSVYDLRSRHGAHTNAHTTEYAGVRLIIRLIDQLINNLNNYIFLNKQNKNDNLIDVFTMLSPALLWYLGVCGTVMSMFVGTRH